MSRAALTVVLVCALAAYATGAPAPDDQGVRTLYLVRHGYYDWDNDADPDIGKALVPLGVAQARLTAARLRAMPVEFTALYSSTMTRARQTAFVIHEDFPGLEVQQTRILRECTPTTWREDIMADEDPQDVAACEERLEAAFAEFFKPSPDGDRHEILVCHGNVIRYLITRALSVEPKAWLGMSVGNCSITVIRIAADGAMKVLSVGDVGHIPPNLQTGLFADAGVLSNPSR